MGMSKPSANRPRLYMGEWIDALGLERRKIAKEAGITEGYLSLIINNHALDQPKNPSLGVALALADAIGVGVDLLRHPPPQTVEELRKLPADIVDRLLKR